MDPNLNIHNNIINKLDFFHKESKIPNIIFHGPHGTGKKTIVFDYIKKIYKDDKDKIKNFVMVVNCSHGKGIKFIRDELKLFSKTNISLKENNFKTVVLLNADCLTIDAQSALRRCIELFTHTTRFFLVVQNRFNLLKPILSRFCEMYIPEKNINNSSNLYQYKINNNNVYSTIKKKKQNILKKHINLQEYTYSTLIKLSENLYEKGLSAIDLIDYLENNKINHISLSKKYEIIIFFYKIKKDFRNEKLLLFKLLYFIFLRYDVSLENISFI